MKKNKLLGIFLYFLNQISDFYEFSEDPFNIFSSYYKKVYGYLPRNINKDSFKNIKHYAFKKGYINKKENKIKINKKGEELLKNYYPKFYFKKEKWDNKIRLVIFDIQEINKTKRTNLRRLLKKIGFLMIQKSVWLSPYNQFDLIKKWVKKNKLNEKILLIEASQINIKNKDKIISAFWQ
ncbi:MAG: CRISPR-associated endonuclease Cas2 [Patescibacteria group bacterium]|nr:CRISPR-associated endonuclease Cas2 [Patescibacteria group bacterium]